jgi:hypothetical protein
MTDIISDMIVNIRNEINKEDIIVNEIKIINERINNLKNNNIKLENNFDEEYENLSFLDKRLRRLDILRDLYELKNLGYSVTYYKIDDDYYLMKYEVELYKNLKSNKKHLQIISYFKELIDELN